VELLITPFSPSFTAETSLRIMGKLSKTELREELARHASERNISILEKSDEKEVAHVFGDAFAEDEMVAWVAGLDKDDPQREDKMYALAKYMLRFVNRRCLTGKQGVAAGINSHGGGEELAGCMTITPSSCSADSMIDHIIAAFSFGMPPIYKKGEKEKYCPIASKRMEIMVPLTKARKKHMKGTARWLYLQSIGVLRSKHGEGYGSKLLRTITDTADALSVPVYLETESESNESMYHHFGFRTVEKVSMKVPGDDRSDATFSMWLMLRDPK